MNLTLKKVASSVIAFMMIISPLKEAAAANMPLLTEQEVPQQHEISADKAQPSVSAEVPESPYDSFMGASALSPATSVSEEIPVDVAPELALSTVENPVRIPLKKDDPLILEAFEEGVNQPARGDTSYQDGRIQEVQWIRQQPGLEPICDPAKEICATDTRSAVVSFLYRDVYSSNDLKTPESIARYMWQNFRFENDRRAFGTEEYWQSLEEFLTSRRGDCEDFALFAQQSLKMSGVRSFLLNIYGSRTAHTVCVFQEDGKYSVIDGTKVKHYKADDLKSLLTKIDPFWKTSAIVIPSATSHTGQIIRTITK